MNPYLLHLRTMAFGATLTELESLLHALANAVFTAEQAIGRARGEYLDVLQDEHDEQLENLLGMGFTLGQTALTRVISRSKRLFEAVRARGDGPLNCVQSTLSASHGNYPRKADLLAYKARKVPGTQITAVQAINAAANYWKHKSEWKGSWATATGQTKTTIDVLTALGATQNNQANLRHLSTKLGARAYIHPWTFVSDPITMWASRMREGIVAELKRHNLVPASTSARRWEFMI